MKSFYRWIFVVFLALLFGCQQQQPQQPTFTEAEKEALKKEVTEDKACWGQASAVFAQMGLTGEHSSSFDTPRLGLRNLARVLFEAEVIPDDSMQALGAFVADALGLSIEACGG